MKKDTSRMQSQVCLGYAETKLFLCKKIFIYFCLFFSIFSLHAPKGHKTYQVIILRLLKRLL